MKRATVTAPASNKLHRHLRLSDIRGVAQLATQAIFGVTRIVEGVHHSVLHTIGISEQENTGQTRGVTGIVYRSIHGATSSLGKGLDASLSALEALLGDKGNGKPTTPERESFLAALNGVMGDWLLARDNPLAISMTLRYQDEVLNGQSIESLPAASGKVMLLIHGLCMNDLRSHARRQDQQPDHGEVLASALGYTPVYLRYNSGLHISQNGHELAAQLEQLVTHWPTPIEELTVVAHSMGGLLIRSAVHYAKEKGLCWPDQLQNIVFLGTPHHGHRWKRQVTGLMHCCVSHPTASHSRSSARCAAPALRTCAMGMFWMMTGTVLTGLIYISTSAGGCRCPTMWPVTRWLPPLRKSTAPWATA